MNWGRDAFLYKETFFSSATCRAKLPVRTGKLFANRLICVIRRASRGRTTCAWCCCSRVRTPRCATRRARRPWTWRTRSPDPSSPRRTTARTSSWRWPEAVRTVTSFSLPSVVSLPFFTIPGIITSPSKTTYLGRFSRPARLDRGHGLLPPPTFLASGRAPPRPPPTPYWCAIPILFLLSRSGWAGTFKRRMRRWGSAPLPRSLSYLCFSSRFRASPDSPLLPEGGGGAFPHPLAISFNFTRLQWY